MAKIRQLRLENFVPYRLSIAANAVSDVIARAYKTLFGLDVAEWRLIAVLAENEKLSQMGLGAATRMDKVTVSRACVRLINRGLARRETNEKDRREQLLSLSKEGRALYDQVAPKALALEDAILKGFTQRELVSLKSMLERLNQAAARVEKK
jgi:DNA-binding MarR family transcriptional regulator